MNALGFFDAPLGAKVIGYDDAGFPVYQDVAGNVFWTEPEGAKPANTLGLFNAGRNPDVRLRDVAGNVLRGLWEGAKQGVTAPGRAASGEPVTHGDVWATALDWGVMGVPVGSATMPDNALGIFAGRRAKTANLDALSRADDMARAGASRDEIWRDTGWFQGVDGQWRFEIDDSASAFEPRLEGHAWDDEYFNIPIEEAMPHGTLYDAYPDLARGRTAGEVNWHVKESGSYNPKNDTIRINARSVDDARSVGLHEAQHGVQTREGFARGASPAEYTSGRMFDERARALNADFAREMIGRIDARPKEYLGHLDLGDAGRLRAIAQKHGFESVEDAAEFLRKQDVMRTPIDQYRRTAGEVEARNVQTRRDFTPDQRRATPPWETQDVPDAEQIVLRGF